MKRRTLLKAGLAAVGTLPLTDLAEGFSPQTPPGFTEPQITTLKAIAALVLPSEVGRTATDRAAIRFARWVRHYEPNAEMDHGYGFTRVRATGPSPLPAYVSQLTALDARTGRRGGSFVALPPAQQRILIQESLEGVERLPGRPDGRNLAADLMAFYFHSSEATDLCYRADIGRDTCRGLPGSNLAPRRRRQ